MSSKFYEKKALLHFTTDENQSEHSFEVEDFTIAVPSNAMKNNSLILVAEFDSLHDSEELRNIISGFMSELSKVDGINNITAQWGENERYSFADVLDKGHALLSAQNKAGDSKKNNSKQGIAFDAWQKWQQSIVDNKPTYKTQADFIRKEILDLRLVTTDRQALEWIRCWKMGKFYPCRN